MSLSSSLPQYVVDLVNLYGAPSQAGFGSAVFYEVIEPGLDLEPVALKYYQHFVGKLWEQFGEAAWMSAWKQVYARTGSNQPDIVAELKGIAAQEITQFVPMLLSVNDDSEQTAKTLSIAYDAPDMADLKIYAIGDSAAMSGLLIAGCRTTGETSVLIALLD